MFALTVHSELRPSIVTLLAVLLLSYFHISRMISGYMSWSLDVSGPLMLMTAKFSMAAFDLADGRQFKSGKALSPDAHVSESRTRTCVVNCPGIIEYMVYIFDFLGVIAGPVFHLREYIDFIYLRNDFDTKLGGTHSLTIAGKRFLGGCVLGGLYAAAGLFPQLSFAFVETEEFSSMSLIPKIILVHFTTSAMRLKYYFAWYMADAACLSAGIGYSPSNRDKFTRSQNAVLQKVDWANCQAEALSHWNISISRWLRSCIYLRAIEAPVPRPLRGVLGHRQYATILTRFVSAFWHGFYPGYYLAFFSTVLQSEADSIARRFIKPMFVKPGSTTPSWIYTLGGKIHTALCLNYYGASFLVLSAASSLHLWKSLYFVGHLVNIATIILVPLLFRSRRKTETPKKVD